MSELFWLGIIIVVAFLAATLAFSVSKYRESDNNRIIIMKCMQNFIDPKDCRHSWNKRKEERHEENRNKKVL